MEIGIGLPSVMPDTPGTLLLHWARKNEELALWAFIQGVLHQAKYLTRNRSHRLRHSWVRHCC